MGHYPVSGSGLGLRRAFLKTVAESFPDAVDFIEVAPDNWIDIGGKYARQFNKIVEQVPLICHGLSLNIGGQAPLDEAFPHKIKRFLDIYQVPVYKVS